MAPRGRRKATAAKPPTPPPEEEEEEEEEEVAAAEEEMEVDAPPPIPPSVRPSSSARPSNNDTGEEYDDEVDDDDDDEEEEDPDASTLKVLLSTDNHLGYLERDPIRGRDSFAAFEEVLSLARRHKVDMVLLSGDLFHENKPSRKTMHTVSSVLCFCCV